MKKKYKIIYLTDIVFIIGLYILNILSNKKAGVNHHVIFKSLKFINTYMKGYNFVLILSIITVCLIFSLYLFIKRLKQKKEIFDCILLIINLTVLIFLTVFANLQKSNVFYYTFTTFSISAIVKMLINIIILTLNNYS